MLLDSLDEFICGGSLTSQLALIVVKNFDRTIAEVLAGAADRNMALMVGPSWMKRWGGEVRTNGRWPTAKRREDCTPTATATMSGSSS